MIKLKLIPKIEVSSDVYIEAQYELQPRSMESLEIYKQMSFLVQFLFKNGKYLTYLFQDFFLILQLQQKRIMTVTYLATVEFRQMRPQLFP